MTRLSFGTDSLCRRCHGSGCPLCGGAGVIVNAVPLARREDPPTSHQAARDATPKAGTHRARALAELRRAGSDGLTDFELSLVLGVQQTSIGVRRKELVDAGLVVATERTRPSPSGSQARVWVCVR